MTKILIVCGLRVFPVASGGQVRTGGFAAALARMGYEVTLYSLTGRRPDYAAYRPWRENYRVDVIEPRLREETYLGARPAITHAVTRYLGHARYWQVEMLRSGRIPRRLHDALLACDAVVSDHAFIPRIPGPWSAKPWFLLSHQLEYRLLEQGSARLQTYAARMLADEQRIPLEFDDVFACADEDREFFRAADAAHVLSVPLVRCGVDPLLYRWTPQLRDRTRAELGVAPDERLLVFSGSSYAPNNEALEGLKEFARTQSSFLAQHRLRFLVLGSVERNAYREGAIIATGRVAEVLPYFAAADAGLNPVVRGAGANVKLFEYMAAGLPVLSTVFGVRGSNLVAGSDYIAFEPGGLREALEYYATAYDGAGWRAQAALVWERHRASCDIGELVRSAIAQARHFPAP